MTTRILGWRHVPKDAQPCHLHWVHHASGRWNRQGEYGALYTALHPYGALLEYSKILGKSGITSRMAQPRELVSLVIEVERLLDLRDPAWVLAYRNWTAEVLSDSEAGEERCRAMADDAIALGFSAIRVPSAIMPGTPPMDNVILFPHTRPANWSIADGPDRYPIDSATESIDPTHWRDMFARYPHLMLPGMGLWG